MIPKGRQSNIKRAYEQGRKDILKQVNEKIDEIDIHTTEFGRGLLEFYRKVIKKSLGEIK